MKQVELREGAIFLVPLTPSGYATGVLARWDKEGRAFGYFFGPRISGSSDVELGALRPHRAVVTSRFGDHGLHTGRWPVVGVIQDWARQAWNLPKFARKHDRADRVYLVEYDDTLNVKSERVVAADSPEVKDLPYDSQPGSGIIEARLSKILVSN